MTEFDPVSEGLLTITDYQLLGELPDPFRFDSGRRLTDPAEWPQRRRELYQSAVELQYGTQPPAPEFVDVELLYTSANLNGYHIHTGTRARPVTFRMQLLIPPDYPGKGQGGRFPVIVDGDQCWRYFMDREFLNAALANGIGWAFFDRTELAHDLNYEGRGCGQLYGTYPEYTFGALGAWAWGYSRVVDALEQLKLPIDLDWIIFTGHSRGAKTAALAGAIDERARIVNPNETCCSGCSCYRIHITAEFNDGKGSGRSETLDDMCRVFPFWIGTGMEQYRHHEELLPFDSHYLKALVAPRTLFVSEAAWDVWANPVGSWQTTLAAGEVFKFLGAEDNLFWYFRPGTHAHSLADVQMLVNVIRHQREGLPLDTRMFRIPFAPTPQAFSWRCPE